MSDPKPFVPGEVTTIRLNLYDVLHTIKRGHKMQILVQSSMFPFLDRNPQTYVDNIFEATEEDFVKATHTIHMGGSNASKVTFTVLPQ